MARLSTVLVILAAAAVTVSALSVVSDDWRPRERGARGTGRTRDRASNKGVKLYGEFSHRETPSIF